MLGMAFHQMAGFSLFLLDDMDLYDPVRMGEPDVALVTLEDPVTLSPLINPLCLPVEYPIVTLRVKWF